MDIAYRKFTDFQRGILFDLLVDAYAFDARYFDCWADNWRATDDFFYDHPEIADRCGFITCLGDAPIGFICWDPRNRPAFVEIGHNGIRFAYKGRGYGQRQLREALRRIQCFAGLREIRVKTNANLIAPKNYERAGFTRYGTEPNTGEAPFAGAYLYYRMVFASASSKDSANVHAPRTADSV